ncbi:MAG: regulatory protein GemA [Subdoligranulum sp.]|nr:regulatory protein GemA [Subdoligranulum sp.]
MSGSACNAYQIRKIYAIGGALGMVKRGEDDDLLHELVNGMTGKTSIKELTYGEACKVIGELEGRQGTPRLKERAGRTSEGQRRKIWALMYQLQAASPSKAQIGDRLCAIIKKELGIDAVPKNPFAWIDYKGGNKLVEVLKGYVKTAEKARGDADG